MTGHPKGFMPPLPRERSAPTLSEVIPFRSRKISVWRSRALLPLLVVALAVVVLYGSFGQIGRFIDVVAWLAVGSIFLAVHAYSGIAKRWWWYLAPAVATAWLLDDAFGPYAKLFRHVLPGDVGAVGDDKAFVPRFVAYFFGAGLCEEALKATPVLLALAAALGRDRLAARGRAAAAPARGRASRLLLQGPLDGLLMGFAAGGAFILYETLTEYVPHTIDRVGAETQDRNLALLAGLELVLPRVLQAASGHMGWAGIFGYFIGLSARYPGRAAALIPFGYLVAAILHGLWDSVDALPHAQLWYAAVSIASVLLLVSCLLKARQLDRAWGDSAGAAGSILIDAPERPAGSLLREDGAGPLGSVLARLREVATRLEAAAGGAIHPEPSPVAGSGILAPPAAPERLSIGAAGDRYRLEAGRSIDFAALFSAPAGARGDVDRHPADPAVLGLTNTGEVPWRATTLEGAGVTVPAGVSLRLAPGLRIELETVVLDVAPC